MHFLFENQKQCGMVWGYFHRRDTTECMLILFFVGLAKSAGGGGILIGMSRIQLNHTYDDIISIENLLLAWHEFLNGKRGKADVQDFQMRLFENISSLHNDLKDKSYRHGGYKAFRISDPKPRQIHKACVRDRLLHHAIYRILYPFFDRTFIADSYSCRINKGTHKAISRFRSFSYQVSENHIQTAWVLKCDIRKFFDSIDHSLLKDILIAYIPDQDILNLLFEIISSFHSKSAIIGVPLGNLTSQLFVNIYMNEFDQFMKHYIKAKYYIRYADDFVIFLKDKNWLEKVLLEIDSFLTEKLHLNLHPDKVFIKTISSGLDFLGWIHFPDYKILRTSTRKRIAKNLKTNPSAQSVNSYKGLLKHGNTHKFRKMLKIE